MVVCAGYVQPALGGTGGSIVLNYCTIPFLDNGGDREGGTGVIQLKTGGEHPG